MANFILFCIVMFAMFALAMGAMALPGWIESNKAAKRDNELHEEEMKQARIQTAILKERQLNEQLNVK